MLYASLQPIEKLSACVDHPWQISVSMKRLNLDLTVPVHTVTRGSNKTLCFRKSTWSAFVFTIISRDTAGDSGFVWTPFASGGETLASAAGSKVGGGGLQQFPEVPETQLAPALSLATTAFSALGRCHALKPLEGLLPAINVTAFTHKTDDSCSPEPN